MMISSKIRSMLRRYRTRLAGRGCCNLLLTLFVTFPLLPRTARAQGCIIAHSTASIVGPASQGGYLAPKHWQLTVGARHQFSFRHFVGPVEQEYRFQLGNQVENKINLTNFDLTYQATERVSFSINVPVLFATRRASDSPYTQSSQGIGDIPVGVKSWIWKPSNAKHGNIAFGVGLQFPTGLSDIKSVVNKQDGNGNVTISNDYSIQPGIGGWGIELQGEGFKTIGSKAVLYADGSYLVTPQNMNHTLVRATNPPLTQYVSISDEYLIEIGVAYPIAQVPGLSMTFGPRDEGVPAHDLIGSNDGFRRPGFAISLEPGLQWVHHKNIWTFQVGKAIYRDRVRSYPDIVYGAHGDAAFADYVWLASYTYRF
jgi:hypothetical protein